MIRTIKKTTGREVELKSITTNAGFFVLYRGKETPIFSKERASRLGVVDICQKFGNNVFDLTSLIKKLEEKNIDPKQVFISLELDPNKVEEVKEEVKKVSLMGLGFDFCTGIKQYKLSGRVDKSTWKKLSMFFVYHAENSDDCDLGFDFRGWITSNKAEVEKILKNS